MASSTKQVLVAVVAVAIATILAAPAPALAADLLVGDGGGWRLNIDYDKWVDGNDFIVGDTLVFKYAKGQHSVVQATAASYAACDEANSLGVWTSGDDRVTLNTSGTWWFFCGVGDHCQEGMKFNVTVLPAVHHSPSIALRRRMLGAEVMQRGSPLLMAEVSAGLAAGGGVAAVAALLF